MQPDILLSRRVVIVAAAAAAVGCASTPAVETVPALTANLAPLSRFVGRWKGTGSGEPGQSTVERSYTPVLAGQFIEVRHRSVYAPQEKNPKGETHDDIGYLSFDRARKRFVLRQFHVESFVNQFVAATAGFDGDRIAFDSEAIENIPAGFRARESYTFSGADAFEEVFEIAEPGKDFTVYSHNRFTRA